jgi:hypothetical protein
MRSHYTRFRFTQLFLETQPSHKKGAACSERKAARIRFEFQGEKVFLNYLFYAFTMVFTGFNSILRLKYHVDVGDVADISEVHNASILNVEL